MPRPAATARRSRPTTGRSPTSISGPTSTRTWRSSSGRSPAHSPEEGQMQLGFIGLGLMGANMSRRLAMDGHDLLVHNRTLQVATDLPAELTSAGHAVVAAP